MTRALPPALSMTYRRALTNPQLPDRVLEVLTMLDQLTRLPDAGMHSEDCWQRHKDCLAERVSAILTGREADRG